MNGLMKVLMELDSISKEEILYKSTEIEEKIKDNNYEDEIFQVYLNLEDKKTFEYEAATLKNTYSVSSSYSQDCSSAA